MTLAPGSTSSGAGTLTNGYTLVNQGSWSIADDELLVCDGSTLRNEGALTISSNATSIGDCGAGPNLFHNTSTGTVTKASGIESYIDVPFTNDGTLSVSAGRLLLVRDDLTNLTGTTLTGGIYDLPGFVLVSDAAGGGHQRRRPAAVGLWSALPERLGRQRPGIAHHQRGRRTHRVAQRHPDGGGPVVHELYGEISGVGTLDATTVTNSGTVAPGLSPGILTIDGDFASDLGRRAACASSTVRPSAPATTASRSPVRPASAGTLQLVTGFSPGFHRHLLGAHRCQPHGHLLGGHRRAEPRPVLRAHLQPDQRHRRPVERPSCPPCRSPTSSMAEGSSRWVLRSHVHGDV